MAFEKAFIMPINGKSSGKSIEVLFNPNEYSLETSNQFQRTAVPGTQTPATQFVSGNTRTLTMDLFFDSYEKQEDVRQYTSKITRLLDIDPDLKAPPICEFRWGYLSFRATLEQVNQKFTLFLASGVPVRATLSVTFKEYKTLSDQLYEPTSSEPSDLTRSITVQQGDTFQAIAYREYGDPSLWQKIADANEISNPNPDLVEVGQELIIPFLN